MSTAEALVGKIVRLRFAVLTMTRREVPAGHRFRVSHVNAGKLILIEMLPLLEKGQIMYLSKVPVIDVEVEAVQPVEAQAST